MRAKIALGDIHVKNIETTSGIFVSRNNFVNGWRSQIKSNYGFGVAGDQSSIENCVFIVSDDDIIDSPVIDNSILIEKNVSATDSDTLIHFNKVKVESLNGNATVTIGDSKQSGWSSRSKINSGNGRFVGENIIANNKIMIDDEDAFDTPVFDHHTQNNF